MSGFTYDKKAFEMSGTSVAVVFTWNNYPKNAEELLKKTNYKYILFGFEECPTTGTPHLQGYMQSSSKFNFVTLQKKCPGIWAQRAKGSYADNKEYCSKSGNTVELGQADQNMGQGNRSDLQKTVLQISEGKKKPSDVLLEDAILYNQYRNTLNAAHSIYLKQWRRTAPPTILWLYGCAGSGKTRYAYDLHPDLYRKTFNEKYWCGYDGESTILLDDFRPMDCPFNELLHVMDRYTHSVPRKNLPQHPLMHDVLIITAPSHPRDMFKDVGENLNQLTRRITEIIQFPL